MTKDLDANKLHALFQRLLTSGVKNVDEHFEVVDSGLRNSAESVETYGAELNPRTRVWVYFKKRNSDVKLHFNLSGAEFNNPDVGSFTVMLFDYTGIGTEIGNYVAWKKTGCEVEYSNPFYFNYECLETSLTKQIRFVCEVLRDDFKKVIAGIDTGVWDIPKKDWRSYQED